MGVLDRIKRLFGGGSGAEAGNTAAYGAVVVSADAEGRDSDAESASDSGSGAFDFGGGDSGGSSNGS